MSTNGTAVPGEGGDAGADASGDGGTEGGAECEQGQRLAEGVLEQVARGGAERLEDGDFAAALHGPDGEEGADDQGGDGEQQGPHQLQGAVLGGVGADRGERLRRGEGRRAQLLVGLVERAPYGAVPSVVRARNVALPGS